MKISLILSGTAQAITGLATVDYVFILISAVLLAGWLIKTDLGTRSLDKAGYRRNFMPYYLPAAVIFGWLFLTWAASSLAASLTAGLADWQQKFVLFLLLFVNEVVIIVFILAAAKKYFEGVWMVSDCG